MAAALADVLASSLPGLTERFLKGGEEPDVRRSPRAADEQGVPRYKSWGLLKAGMSAACDGRYLPQPR